MSTYEDRIRKQPLENQDIYYAWLSGTKLQSNGNYRSAISEFLEFRGNRSILEIKAREIEAFRDRRELKPGRKASKLRYLKNFLVFVKEHYPVVWDFDLADLKKLLPGSAEVKASKTSATPLTAKEFIRMYRFLGDHIQEREWRKVYTVFRLMYNYGLSKSDIAKIDSKTYNLKTGELYANSYSPITFDDEIVSLFQENGLDFLPKNHWDVYDLLKKIGEILDRNITQETIKRTRERFRLVCPQCGELIENNPRRFGFVQVDILNLGSLIVCQDCLGKVL